MVVLLDELGTINALHVDDRPALLDALGAAHVDRLEIDGSGITDAATFFERTGAAMGLSERERPTTWSGLSSRLWSHLAAHSTATVVVVWMHADRLAGASMDDYLGAVEMFVDLARSVATNEVGFPRPLRLVVVLLGDSPAFRTRR